MKWNERSRSVPGRERENEQHREFIRTMKACRGDRTAQREAVLLRLRQRGGEAA